MRKELIVKSKSLGGVSDLTLLAPIKPGLVPALDAVTYKTRTRRLLKTLSLGRASSHEHALLRPFSDAVERVGKIHSVRVAVVEPDQVLLAVTFDGSWESYLRVLWQKVGALLDVIFCNTVDYPPACDSPFDEWAGWVQRVQIETDFFYGMPRLTVDDVQYLRREERLRRESPEASDSTTGAVRAANQRAEAEAWDLARRQSPAAVAETVRLALQSLSVIHRLAALYLPAGDDGKFLHRAARELLVEFVRLKESTRLIDSLVLAGRGRFAEQLDWLFAPPVAGRAAAPAHPSGVPEAVRANLQAGIVQPLPRNTDGALLMFAFDSPQAMADFIDAVPPTPDVKANGGTCCQLALTFEGLRRAGLDENALAWFPQEFREGMEARAGLLGDHWHNHPRRWRLPVSMADDQSRVELAAVHLVVQLRHCSDAAATHLPMADAAHPLHREMIRLMALPGCTLLAAEPMARTYEPAGGLVRSERVREHFGFVDGMSDPGFGDADTGDIYDNRVSLGELLLGHPNQADERPDHAWSASQRALMHDGSFLVVRKLRQDVAALHQALDEALTGPLKDLGLKREDLLAKMMGRTPDGDPLARERPASDPARQNDFDYAHDAAGSRCPLHAHIRRANPRPTASVELPSPPGGRFPRLLRRGMSYGPRYVAPTSQTPMPDDRERGLMFMAFNASIAEQFEVVQRWLAGGNSSGGFSGQSDPFLGVAETGRRRRFRFELEDKGGSVACALALDGPGAPLAPYRPFVQLEWGMYLFVPSLAGLAHLQWLARRAARLPAPEWDAARGRVRLQAWARQTAGCTDRDQVDGLKALLEDPLAIERYEAAGVWAAIRTDHGGALRTPHGVLVCDASLVRRVLARSGSDFTVNGYHQRMKPSIGEIYLGLDDRGPGCPYREQSEVPNRAIQAITSEEAFDTASRSVHRKLALMTGFEKMLARATNRPAWELNLNLKEIVDQVIEDLCRAWFGLPGPPAPDDPRAPTPPAEPEFAAGPARWDWADGTPPRCPGNFSAPSRYFFQPWPNDTVEDFGRRYGSTLTQAMLAYVQRRRQLAALPAEPLAKAIFSMRTGGQPASDELVARTLVGAMMGFIPTLDGALRLVLNEWLRDGDFWSLRASWVAAQTASAQAETTKALDVALRRAMQLRPMPELVWRVVARDCHLGPLALKEGETVVVSLVSAMHQALEEGSDDVMAMFGGDRAAHPFSHACPGYAAAMGALRGALAALVQSQEPMRPSHAPLALTLGPLPALPSMTPHPPPPPPNGEQVRRASMRTGSSPSGVFGTRPVLLAEGDSWFDHWAAPGASSLLKPLAQRYEIVEVASAGDTLEVMCRPDQLDELALQMRRLRGRGITPLAVLISAGGNDVVHPVLEGLLNRQGEGVEQALNDAEADKFIQGLGGMLASMLKRVLEEIDRYFGTSNVPSVVLHGYDYPIPDGRGALGELGNWLLPSFLAKGWGPDFAGERQVAMKSLIDKLNVMQQGVAAGFPAGRVVHVDLRDTLDAGSGYKSDWQDELHPTERGFGALGRKLEAGMLTPGKPSQPVEAVTAVK
ncbi:MAG: hypothetical protein ACOZJX_19250 [Pseudomonadota bacterium]